ncbi:MAG: hypothetical protein AAF192_05715 [Pseudomonadota bacterium]
MVVGEFGVDRQTERRLQLRFDPVGEEAQLFVDDAQRLGPRFRRLAAVDLEERDAEGLLDPVRRAARGGIVVAEQGLHRRPEARLEAQFDPLDRTFDDLLDHAVGQLIEAVVDAIESAQAKHLETFLSPENAEGSAMVPAET